MVCKYVKLVKYNLDLKSVYNSISVNRRTLHIECSSLLNNVKSALYRVLKNFVNCNFCYTCITVQYGCLTIYLICCYAYLRSTLDFLT